MRTEYHLEPNPDCPVHFPRPQQVLMADELAEVGSIMRAILNDPDSAHRSQAMQTAVLAAAFVLAFPGPMSRRLLLDTLRELRDDMPHGDMEDHR
jgi:hypothetical protein